MVTNTNPKVLLKRILVILTKLTQWSCLQHKIYEASKPETKLSFPDLTTYFKVSFFGQLGFRNQPTEKAKKINKKKKLSNI